MYTFCIIMIAIASILLILAVLVQSPKSGMAANFGAANQTMGVRQTTDFLEKFTWAMIAAVVFFSLLSVVTLSTNKTEEATLKSKAGELLESKQNVEATEEIDIAAEADATAVEATEVVETTVEE
ncbi:MAG: preprotein translocase subunit SecG [Alistipes sp.]|nr:preprotein translocase subunit SecG [Alistipes sp.]